MKNISFQPAIRQTTIIGNANNWLTIVRYGESGSVIQLQDDCEYRVNETISDKKILKSILGPFYKKYILKYIPIDQKDLLKTIKHELIKSCLERKLNTKTNLEKFSLEKILTNIAEAGYEVGLFISHISPLLNQKNFQPFIDLELLIRMSKNLSVIVFSEIDISHKKFSTLTDKASFLFDHLFYYPLYDKEDCLSFINHYSNKWSFKMNTLITNEIIHSCGGYLWLIHQAIRNLRDNPKLSIQQILMHDLILKKLEIIWNKLTDQEKNIIRKVIFGSLTPKETLTHEYEYLIKIRMLLEKKNKSYLGIPLLSLLVEKENKLNELMTFDKRIIIGEKDISYAFSKEEKAVMCVLLSAKKKIVSRDTIAQAIWGKDWEEKYSDWAIDRLFYRLRKKLQKLCIDEKLIRTIKKKGFAFG